VHEYFGEPEEERGPGRPEIGGTISVRLGDALPLLDTYVKNEGLPSRADALRKIIHEKLG
jgi:hypothetical protein